MGRQVLVLGATGMLGKPVVRCLLDAGHRVRALVRSVEKANRILGNSAAFIEGSALIKSDIRASMAGCDAVHINLSPESELAAIGHVLDLTSNHSLERITFVSATTASEETRWFEMIDVKMRAEEALRDSGIAHTVFCPTWAMETLHNFIHGNWAAVIVGRRPPPLHFFAAAEFGRIVAASYEDDRALGKRLYVHGPEGITLPEALDRFIAACHPDLKKVRLKLWQAQLAAKLTQRQGLNYITCLIAYFDRVGELGDPAETNALFGAPRITLDEWSQMQMNGQKGLPH